MDVQSALNETFALAKYEAACRAVAEAKTVDEAKDILDASMAMRAYAKQAKNKEMEADAVEIRMRAERRVGQLMAAQDRAVGLSKGGRPPLKTGLSNNPVSIALAEAGIDKNLAHRARTNARIPEEEFEEAVKDVRQAVNNSVKKLVDQKLKRDVREEKETDLAAKITALPTQKFGVIVADPEWRFEPYSRETGMDRAPENHYPTSPLDAIKERDVPSIAADDCVLFLWATVPMLPQALEVMAAWGFTYKSHLVWIKDRIGTGYWFRNQHELLLVGTRGNIPAPAMGDQFSSILEASLGEHSEKPERTLEIIESYFPNLPKIELNRRGAPRAGWSAWGNEVAA